MRSIVEAARTELVGRGRIVGVGLGEGHGLSVFVSRAEAKDRAYAEGWGSRHGVKIDLKVIGPIVI